MERIITALDLGVFTEALGPLLVHNSPAIVLISLFVSGLILSLNPCMLVILPLVLGGNREANYKRPFLFTIAFVVTLMIIGFLAAGLGRVLTLPTLFWNIALGLLYLLTGLILLRVRLPIQISGFYVSGKNSLIGRLYTKEGLNPWALGALFALAPSPCTTPVILAISSFALASGNLLLSVLALGLFGLGHSLLLTLAFLPGVQRLFRTNFLTRTARPVLGVFLLGLAIYLLAFQPDLFNNSPVSNHQH
ncbi:MAG: cytochrome C biogenesis protein [Desulfitobacterium hafniense]|nr:cytochrome C biogenesis protein [Desulfitobacterium hafniense]